jgi:1-acyl-sn-glycerol-3-phosphate acyltransferase
MSESAASQPLPPVARPMSGPERTLSTVRSLLFALYQLVITPPYAIFMLSLFWLPIVPRYKLAKAWCWLMLQGARWICGIRFRVTGMDNVPPATPCIVMSKHSSTWETLALTQVFPPLAYVAKKELLSIPFFGWAFRFAAPITIDRKAGSDAMTQIVSQGRERLAQGFWIVIYPEGTRIRAGTRARYKTGGCRLAAELKIPLLPVAHNAGWLWPKGTLGKRPGTITLSIGKPMYPGECDLPTLAQRLETMIEDDVARMGHP